MLLHRVSPCAQAETIPEEVQPQVEGVEEEEEEAVQEASEAKVRGAEQRQLVSTVENADDAGQVPAAPELPAQAPVTASPRIAATIAATIKADAPANAHPSPAMMSPVMLPAATPLAAAATPFAAAAPAAHDGKAPLRPKSLAAISGQPAAHLEEVEEAALDESSVAALPSVHVAVAAADQVPADGPAAPPASPPADAAAAELTVGASASVRDEDRAAPLQLAAMQGHVEVILPAQAPVTASPRIAATVAATITADSANALGMSPVMLPAASPLAAAATPFAAPAPAAHNGKAPLRPKSLAAISDQPATALTAAHAGVPMLADAVSAASGDVGREATAHEAAAAPPSHAPLPMAEFPALYIPAAPAEHQSSPQAEVTAETVTVIAQQAQQATAAAEHAAQQAAALNAWLVQHSAPQLAASDGATLGGPGGVAASPPVVTAAVEHGAAPMLMRPTAIRKQPPQGSSPLPPGHFKRPRDSNSSSKTWDPTRASNEWRRSPLSLTPGAPAAPITPMAAALATTPAAAALGGIARPWQALAVEPMFSMQQRLAKQGMTLSDPEPILSGPRASWHSPSLDVGLRLSAEESADDPRTSPAPLAMGAAAPTAPTCLRSGGASHPPSAPRSASPQPLDLFTNGGQPGVQSASRGPPSAMQPLHTEPSADAAARTGARGGPRAAAANAASLPSPAVLSAPNVRSRMQGARRQGLVSEPDGILVSARPRPSPVTEQQPRMPNGKRSALEALASSPDGGAGGSQGDAQLDGLGPARRQQRRAAAAVDDVGPQRGAASVPASVRDAGSSGSGSTQLLNDLDGLASMEDARRLRGDATLGTADGAGSDDEQVTFEAAMEQEAAEEEAAEEAAEAEEAAVAEEAAEEEAAMEARPAEGRNCGLHVVT